MTFKYLYFTLSAGLSATIVYFKPTFPLIIFMAVLWLYDVITAICLQKKLHKDGKIPNPIKIESKKLRTALKTLNTMFLAIVAAHILDVTVFHFLNGLHLANWVTGICAFVNLYSILENKIATSENKLAKLLKKIMIDKTAKWIDISKDVIENELK